MKIAISGASGTGKTTLARMISEHYQIPLNPVGSRTVAKEMGFDNPYDVDKAGLRVEFQSKLFEAKRKWEQEHDSFVTDRSYMDNATYCALHMAEHLTEKILLEHMKAMEIYDFVFKLRLDAFQSLDDGVRQTNKLYHQLYEMILASFDASACAVRGPHQVYRSFSVHLRTPETRMRAVRDLVAAQLLKAVNP